MSELTTVEPAAVETADAFASRLVETVTAGLVTALLDVGRRTDLFAAAAEGPASSAELAARRGLQERYVREWLAAMATAGIVAYDPATERFWLPAERAAVLTGDSYDNLTPLAYLVTTLTRQVAAVADCFTSGGGVPFEAYLPELHDVMDTLWRPMFRDLLIPQILPLAPELPGLLESGARVADIGCGGGNALLVLAARYRRSVFVGYDQDAEAIDIARRRAAEAGLGNLSFEVADAAALTATTPYDAVLVFNAVHDQAHPDRMLAAARALLRPGGTFLMHEPRISSRLADNLDNPLAPMVYAVSVLHCLTVALAEGGAGLGAGWGEQTARALLAEAGFGPVAVHDAPGDPGNAVFVTHRPD